MQIPRITTLLINITNKSNAKKSDEGDDDDDNDVKLKRTKRSMRRRPEGEDDDDDDGSHTNDSNAPPPRPERPANRPSISKSSNDGSNNTSMNDISVASSVRGSAAVLSTKEAEAMMKEQERREQERENEKPKAADEIDKSKEKLNDAALREELGFGKMSSEDTCDNAIASPSYAEVPEQVTPSPALSPSSSSVSEHLPQPVDILDSTPLSTTLSTVAQPALNLPIKVDDVDVPEPVEVLPLAAVVEKTDEVKPKKSTSEEESKRMGSSSSGLGQEMTESLSIARRPSIKKGVRTHHAHLLPFSSSEKENTSSSSSPTVAPPAADSPADSLSKVDDDMTNYENDEFDV